LSFQIALFRRAYGDSGAHGERVRKGIFIEDDSEKRKPAGATTGEQSELLSTVAEYTGPGLFTNQNFL
jgi:hypothetical protein